MRVAASPILAECQANYCRPEQACAVPAGQRTDDLPRFVPELRRLVPAYIIQSVRPNERLGFAVFSSIMEGFGFHL